MSRNTFASTIGVFLLENQTPVSHIRHNGDDSDDALDYLFGEVVNTATDATGELLEEYIRDEYGDTAGDFAGSAVDYAKDKSGYGTSTSISAFPYVNSVLAQAREQNRKSFYGRLTSPDFLENTYGVRDASFGLNSTRSTISPEASSLRNFFRAYDVDYLTLSQIANRIGASNASVNAVQARLGQLFFSFLGAESARGVKSIVDAAKFFIDKYPFVSNVRMRIDPSKPAWQNVGVKTTTFDVHQSSARPLHANTIDFRSNDGLPERFRRQQDYNAYVKSILPQVRDFILQVFPQWKTATLSPQDAESLAKAIGRKFQIDVQIGNDVVNVGYDFDSSFRQGDKVIFIRNKPHPLYATTGRRVSSQADVERILTIPGRGLVSLQTMLAGGKRASKGIDSGGATELTQQEQQEDVPKSADGDTQGGNGGTPAKKKPFLKTTAGMATLIIGTLAIAGGIAYVANKE